MGRGDGRVAPPEPARHARPVGPTGKRFVLDTAELRFVVIRRVLERIARGAPRPPLVRRPALRLAQHVRHARAPATATRRDCACSSSATARSETLETDLDAALRMEALRARVERAGRRARSRSRPTTPRRSCARRSRSHDDAVARADRAEPRQPALRAPAPHAWAGGGYLKHGGRRATACRTTRCTGAPSRPPSCGTSASARCPTELRLAAYAAAAHRRRRPRRGAQDARRVARDGPARRLVALTRAQISSPSGNDQFRWPHALLQEHLMQRLHERNDAPAIFRLAANALAKHPARRVAPHHEAPRDEPARARVTTTSRRR